MHGSVDTDFSFLEGSPTETVVDAPVTTGGHRRPKRKRKVAKWTAIGVAGTLLLGGGAATALLMSLDPRLPDLPEVTGTRPPKPANNAMNILIMGTDTRDGANDKYGRQGEGERSDTTILLHLSATGDKAVALSFPRDSMVKIPDCETGGKTVTGRTDMINSAFAYGGAACTVKTIETLTQIRIDHFLKVDFTGFKGIVDALGGVEICAPAPINDRDSKLVIERAGLQTINGEQALGWVRVRHIGDGTDIGRIQRQQQFLASVMKKATSTGVLGNPVKLTKLIRATSSSMAADRGFGMKTMLSLGAKLKDVNLDKIEFKTVPWRYATTEERQASKLNNGRVFWTDDAYTLFDAIRLDNKLPAQPKTRPKPPAGSATTSSATASTADATTPAKPLPPARIKVKVYNGTSTKGLAGRAVATLTSRKYTASLGSTTTYGDGTLAKTVIRYGPGGKAAAVQFAALVPGAKIGPDAKSAPGTVHLYLGADFKDFSTAGLALPEVAGQFKASDDICKVR
ncbi:hypothetical protein GCM10027589_29900 [Actinocorallia lasiicapitis]